VNKPLASGEADSMLTAMPPGIDTGTHHGILSAADRRNPGAPRHLSSRSNQKCPLCPCLILIIQYSDQGLASTYQTKGFKPVQMEMRCESLPDLHTY
jgi:hypothetical protein